MHPQLIPDLSSRLFAIWSFGSRPQKVDGTSTPWKTNGWNLKLPMTRFRKMIWNLNQTWTWLCSILIFRGVLFLLESWIKKNFDTIFLPHPQKKPWNICHFEVFWKNTILGMHVVVVPMGSFFGMAFHTHYHASRVVWENIDLSWHTKQEGFNKWMEEATKESSLGPEDSSWVYHAFFGGYMGLFLASSLSLTFTTAVEIRQDFSPLATLTNFASERLSVNPTFG